jgi:hypothetical protein
MNTRMDEIVRYVSEGVPGQTVSLMDEKEYSKALFRLSADSDYDVELYMYSDEEAEAEGGIHATLRNIDGAMSFWYMPFERPDYKTTEELVAALKHNLLNILSAPTRITQIRGPVLWHFLCEYEKDSEWKKVYGMGALRFTMTVPDIEGNKKAYRGFPVKA